MNAPHPCPPEVTWKELLAHHLPADEQAALANHLEGCADCRRRLDALAGGAGGLPLDLAPTDVSRPSPALEEAIRNLRPPDGEPTQLASSPTATDPAFSFLRPSTDPRHLGRLGDYEILELIGRGGMGIVFKARDTRLERLVAVKVLRPDWFGNAAARQRFLREARAAAAVTHEHVVTIHAVDEAGGVPFLVMEYVLGVSLEDRLQRSGHLTPEEVLRIGRQTASGLAAAHAQGLVHRDIKPGNILLENHVERVKITDFGLVRVLNEVQPTQSELVAGTPAYMSPEQARGERIDHRSDLFSLGCVLYAMATGHSPFRADSLAATVHRVTHDTPRPVREINPEIPPGLVAIIDRLLSKDPAGRFPSATEVADRLSASLAQLSQPGSAAYAAPPAPARRFGPLPAALAACLVLGVLALLGWSWWSRTRPPAPPDVPTGFFPIDLQGQANLDLGESWADNDPGDHLASLPTGDQTFGGIPFKVGPRYLNLRGQGGERHPLAITGIPVHQKAAKLHFLHGIRNPDSYLAEEARYVVHYEDGTTESIPVVAGRDALGWHVRFFRDNATRAQHVWSGRNPGADAAKTQVRLFLRTWQNPYTERTIATLDFEKAVAPNASTCCVAVTGDSDPTPLPPEPGMAYSEIEIDPWGDLSLNFTAPSGAVTTVKGPPSHYSNLFPPGRYGVALKSGNAVLRQGDVELGPGMALYLRAALPLIRLPMPQVVPPLASLQGTSMGILDLDLAPDGLGLVTGGMNGTVALWRRDGAAWAARNIPWAVGTRARAVAFAPDGRLFAAAGNDGSVRLWEPTPGLPSRTLKDAGSAVAALRFSPGTQATLAVGGADGTLELWDAAVGRLLRSWKAHDKPIEDIAFSPDGRRLATGAEGDHMAHVWETESGRLLHTLRGHTDSVPAVAFSPDGQTLATASRDSTVRLWRADTGEFLDVLLTPQALNAVVFHPTRGQVAAAGDFGSIRLWDVASRRVVHDTPAHWAAITGLRFSPDGTTLVSGSWDNTVKLWSLADLPPWPGRPEDAGPRPRTTFDVPDKVFSLAVSPSGGYLACATNSRTILVKSLETLDSLGQITPYGEPTTQSLAFTRDGGRLFACSNEGNCLRGWDMGSFHKPALAIPNTAGYSFLALSPDNEVIACANQNKGTVHAWDATGEPLWFRPLAASTRAGLAFHPGGDRLAVITGTNKFLVLGRTSGKILAGPIDHGDEALHGLAYSPDGKILVSCGADRAVRLWDAQTLAPLRTLNGHRERVSRPAFSPDGKLLVTTGGTFPWPVFRDPWNHDGEICLWDPATGRHLARVVAHLGATITAVFTPDGKTLATSGRDGKVHLWDVAELLKYPPKP